MFTTRMEQSSYLLEKALDAESLRRKVIANNISNVNVPHFKRSEVNFESELKRIINQRENPDSKLPARLTDDRHIPFFIPRDVTEAGLRINHDYSTTYRNDGNNVDIEKEMVDAAKNLMRYNSYVSSINHNFKLMKLSMRTA